MESDAVRESRLAESQGNPMDTVVQTAHQLQVQQDLRPHSTTSHELEFAAAVPLPDISSSTAETMLPTENNHVNSSSSSESSESFDCSPSFQQDGGEASNNWTPKSLRTDCNVPTAPRTQAEEPEDTYDPVSSLNLLASDERSIVAGRTEDDHGDTDNGRHDNTSVPSDDSAHSSEAEITDPKVSTTSTVEHYQEPFDSFRFKVTQLACSAIWPAAKEEEIKVERMRGGSYNRITGITFIPNSNPSHAIKRILRNPRFESIEGPQVLNDVAILNFICRHTTIPVPQVHQWDDKHDNAIGGQFMIQDYMEGVWFIQLWGTLNHKQKCKAAQELGDLYRQMLSFRFPRAGRIVLSSAPNTATELCISPLHQSESEYQDEPRIKPWGTDPPPFPLLTDMPAESTLELLLRLTQEDLDFERASDPEATSSGKWS